MKQTILWMAGLLLPATFTSLAAQTNWNAKNNPVVASINAQYADKYIAPRPALTPAELYPEAGSYQLTGNTDAGPVTVTVDAQNKGKIWVKGLPEGTFSALLRQSPAVYKIQAQKTEEGLAVPEGTLIYDAENSVLRICIGKSFEETNPEMVFTTEPEAAVTVKTKNSKSKKEITPKFRLYSATKMAGVKEE